MGQILTSDYKELYTFHQKRPIPNQNLSLIDRKTLYETIRKLKIVVLSQITDTFEDIDDSIFESHDMTETAMGIYYGKLDENMRRKGIGIQNYKCESPQNPNIQYLGQFSMNQPHGFGFAIFGDDTWYFGTWNKSRVHPQDQQGDLSNFGVCCRSNGELYYGNWFERKLQLGYAQTLQYCYYGEFKNGLPEGFGHCQYYDGTIYSGYWRQGLMEGNGILWYQDRNKYIGTFKQSHKSGFGYEKKQNSEYFGYFKNNKNHGLGTKQTQDEISEGIWIQGELEGLYSKQQIKQGPKKWYVKIDGRTEYLNNVEEQRSIIELHGKQQDFESNKNKLDELYKQLIDITKDIKLKCSEFKEFYYGYLDIMQDWSKLNTLQTWIEQQNQIHI